MSKQIYLDLVLIALVVAAAVQDLAVRRISNRLVAFGLALALAMQLLWDAPLAGFLKALAGAGVGLLIFLPLYCLRGMAAGDVKLMAMAGAFSAPLQAVEIGLATVCIGGVMALLLVIVRGRVRDTLANLRSLLRPLVMRMIGVPLAPEPLAVASVGNIPYGVAIAFGTMLILWYRHR